ncbi:MAG: ATP phosphoribosyltransferase regulatory subunit [Caulobacteraceae bacterium]|nr:ATP phosphoribosyltransferase regulatory subunit [Caulobacteraceae bacterium]
MTLEVSVPADVLEAIRAPFAALGAQAVDPPVIQPLGLLLDLAGEAMHARLVVVQGLGGEESCLRPDFTIPVARAHIDAGAATGRYVYEGKAFRVSPPGAKHAEEFLQIGLEAFGEADAAATDAEVAALAWRASAAGGRDDLTLRLGDVGLYRAFIGALGLAEPLAARLIRAFSRQRGMGAELERAQAQAPVARQGDRISHLLAGLPEGEGAAVLEDLWALAGISPVGGRSAAQIAHRLAQRAEAARAPRLTAAEAGLIRRYLEISDQPAVALERIAALAAEGRLNLDQPLGDWSRRLADLEGAGARQERMVLATGFGRAFGYYDGVLFEVRSAALDETSPVAAGGRYDALTLRLGGRGLPGAVGCMVRPARAWAGASA